MTTMTNLVPPTDQTRLPADAGPGRGEGPLDGPTGRRGRRGRRGILARLLAAADSSAVDLRRFRV